MRQHLVVLGHLCDLLMDTEPVRKGIEDRLKKVGIRRLWQRPPPRVPVPNCRRSPCRRWRT